MRLLIFSDQSVAKCPSCEKLLGKENKKANILPIKFPQFATDILEETIDHMIRDWAIRCPHCNIDLEITIYTEKKKK